MPAKPFQAVTSLLDIQLGSSDKLAFKQSSNSGPDQSSFKESMRKVRDHEQTAAAADNRKAHDRRAPDDNQSRPAEPSSKEIERPRSVDNAAKPSKNEQAPANEIDANQDLKETDVANTTGPAESNSQTVEQSNVANGQTDVTTPADAPVAVEAEQLVAATESSTLLGQHLASVTLSENNTSVENRVVATESVAVTANSAVHTVDSQMAAQSSDSVVLRPLQSNVSALGLSQKGTDHSATIQGFPLQPLSPEALTPVSDSAATITVPALQSVQQIGEAKSKLSNQPVLETGKEGMILTGEARRQTTTDAGNSPQTALQQNAQGQAQLSSANKGASVEFKLDQAGSDSDLEIKTQANAITKEAVTPVTPIRSSAMAFEKLFLDKGMAQSGDGKSAGVSVELTSATKATVHAATEAIQNRQIAATAHNGKITVQANVQFGQAQWPTAIAERAAWLVSQSIQSAEIQLDPPELGPISVKVHVQNDQAAVSFVANNAQVKDALDQSLLRLKEMLQEQGMQLVQADVSDRGTQQQGEGQGSGAAHTGNELETQDEPNTADALVMEISQGIDYYA